MTTNNKEMVIPQLLEALGPAHQAVLAMVVLMTTVVLLKALGMLDRQHVNLPFTPATPEENANLKKG
jgi:hypothetical protein